MFQPNFSEYFDLVLLFKKNLPLRELFVNEPMTNCPEVFTSTPNRIPLHLSDYAISLTNIIRKWPNIIKYFAPMLFNIRFEVEYFNLESSTIWLRLQRFAIGFDDESRSRTPLCQNLMHSWKRAWNRMDVHPHPPQWYRACVTLKLVV